MRSVFFLSCAALLLASCTPPIQYPDSKQKDAAARPPVQRERLAYLQRTAAEPVICTMGTDCNEKWARAQVWVTQHSTYSVKTTTQSTIATNGPIEPTTDAAYTVTRSPNDANSERIDFKADCGTTNGAPAFCVPSALELTSQFKNYLLTGAQLGNY